MAIKNIAANLVQTATIAVTTFLQDYGIRAGRRQGKIERRKRAEVLRRVGVDDRRLNPFDRRKLETNVPDERRLGPIERRKIPPQRAVATRRNGPFERRKPINIP